MYTHFKLRTKAHEKTLNVKESPPPSPKGPKGSLDHHCRLRRIAGTLCLRASLKDINFTHPLNTDQTH